MQKMKTEMNRLMRDKDSNPAAEEFNRPHNSSFGDNQAASFHRRNNVLEESKMSQQPNLQQYSFRLGRGAQAETNFNNCHFGETRYNQTGAQSMSVASASIANNRQSKHLLDCDRVNQDQLIDISNEMDR